ncbi:ABC transporter substrate-binding protein [Rhodococcus sp. (in: high G+C Gram-positive bacteria)]|uniref:ABC transporter substrate-binding protein n=1 Tax=Rhodococcus sp. TaxID=1831 RepID=UPI003BB75A0B
MTVPTTRFHLRRMIGATIAAVAVMVTSCSSAEDTGADTGGPAPAGDGTFPVTVGSGDRAVTVDAQPDAIVSLAPTTTEMLFAVGAGDQVVAVDDRSNYPPQAPVTDLSGYTPNVEAILGYEPDLVLATDDNGDVVAGLAQAGVPTLLLPAPATLDDIYTQIEQVGAATGHLGDAVELAATMRGDIDQILATVPERDQPLSYYHELDDTFYSITDDTFLGYLYGLAGFRSIATGADAYPQLSAEYILESDPDVIFLADSQCCGVTPETVAARAGWGELTAVRDGRIHVLDEDIASRWGPRVVDLLRDLAATAAAVPAVHPTP